MATNGGIIGKSNLASFGKGVQTSITSSGPTSPALAATQPGTRVIQTLILGGGGGGGHDNGGGGGAGGLRNIEINTSGGVALGAAVVGAGGAGGSGPTSKNPGVDSSLVVCGTTYTSTGGGAGGSNGSKTGADGGSGGGATACGIPSTTAGGSGNTPPVSPSQGFGGGPAVRTDPNIAAGGGGGASAVGAVGQPSPFIQGCGGAGLDLSPTYGNIGPTCSVFGGGGGGGSGGTPAAGAGGAGGGGNGAKAPAVAGAGTANTGGGGGGGTDSLSPRYGAAGGSGVVVVKELDKASGVWSMQSQFQAQGAGTWPSKLIAYDLDFMVVAGGGGGKADIGGGAGAGGYRASGYGPSPLRHAALSFTNVLPGASYSVTVGAGGAGGSHPGGSGVNGLDSVFNPGGVENSTMITSTGGGAGRGVCSGAGAAGGSGAGGSANTGAGGAGNTPPTSPAQGTAGANSVNPGSYNEAAGGGGGATTAGAQGVPAGGAGGAGAPNTILGPDTSYAGGGGGGTGSARAGGPGGAGGGGKGGGAGSCSCKSVAGTVNTGGGGGGGASSNPPSNVPCAVTGKSGGSGIVIIRGPSALTFVVSPGCNSTSTHPGGDKIAKFTVSGTNTVTVS